MIRISAFLLVLLSLSSLSLHAQVTGISYQAVIMNPGGKDLPGKNQADAPLANQEICLKFSFKTGGGTTGVVEYEETHEIETDAYGMVNLTLGLGTPVGGTFASFDLIPWISGTKFLEVNLDKSGTCANYTMISDQAFTAVPFALYAVNSPTGPMGAKGDKGDTGDTGAQGVKGDKGDTGDTGAQGVKGDKGDTGDTGATGPAPTGTGIVTVNGGSVQAPGILTGDVTTTGASLETTIGAGKVTNGMLAANAVTSDKIADATIATTDIADGAITTAKIADDAVTSAKIVDATIATADIADGAITNAKLADDAVTSAKIADDAVTSAKIADATIATADIADGAITNAKLADDAVTSAKIADATIATADIANGSITDIKIVAVSGSKVTGIVQGVNGGTGVANTGKTITLGGNISTAGDLTTSGAFPITLTSTATTSVTLPTTGTLYGTKSSSITSAELLESISDETGTGNVVFSINPALVRPRATLLIGNSTLPPTTAGTNVKV